MTTQILIAGFGGQGILFAGKFIATNGLLENKEVSWLPSYGPEMRGGTANCSVIVSDEAVGSPIITTPDVLIAMNLPSLDKFEDAVAVGGKIFVDNSLISRAVVRTDVEVHYIPATTLASEHGLDGLANMIMLGKVFAKTGVVDEGKIEDTMKKVVSEKRKNLYDANLKALALGAGA